jgi:hypothetical protein
MGSVESVESHTIEGLHQELKASATATRKKALDKLLQLSANAANAKVSFYFLVFILVKFR